MATLVLVEAFWLIYVYLKRIRIFAVWCKMLTPPKLMKAFFPAGFFIQRSKENFHIFWAMLRYELWSFCAVWQQVPQHQWDCEPLFAPWGACRIWQLITLYQREPDPFLRGCLRGTFPFLFMLPNAIATAFSLSPTLQCAAVTQDYNLNELPHLT